MQSGNADSPSMTASTAPPAQNSMRIYQQQGEKGNRVNVFFNICNTGICLCKTACNYSCNAWWFSQYQSHIRNDHSIWYYRTITYYNPWKNENIKFYLVEHVLYFNLLLCPDVHKFHIILNSIVNKDWYGSASHKNLVFIKFSWFRD